MKDMKCYSQATGVQHEWSKKTNVRALLGFRERLKIEMRGMRYVH